MTVLSGNAKVKRETRALYRNRPLIVEVQSHEITVREKGRRLRVSVPILSVYTLGFKLLAREEAARKAAARAEHKRR